MAEGGREGGGVVAGERPEGAGADQVEAYDRDEGGEEGHDDEAHGAGRGARGLLVDSGEGEVEAARDDGVEVGDAVEDGD